MTRIPSELPESAKIDFASQPRILLNIILPLVVSIFAAFAMISAFARWDQWFGCLIYIIDRKRRTLRSQLQEILISASLHDAQAEYDQFLDKMMIHPDDLIRMVVLICA